MIGLFMPDGSGFYPCHGDSDIYASDSHFKNYPLFYEFFHGEHSKGIEASHRTGWTALVAELLRRK